MTIQRRKYHNNKKYKPLEAGVLEGIAKLGVSTTRDSLYCLLKHVGWTTEAVDMMTTVVLWDLIARGLVETTEDCLSVQLTFLGKLALHQSRGEREEAQ